MTPLTLLAHNDNGTLWPLEEDGPPIADVASAYRAALEVRELRIARGERPIGFKIGFTNRQMWDRYGVRAPIWGSVWDTTLRLCEGEQAGTAALHGFCQPRLEPEIVFGIRNLPPSDPSLEDLFECVEWLAPGFEVVQSHRPDWKFTAADTIADGGLHACLFVGRRTPVRLLAGTGEALDRTLSGCRVRLFRDDIEVEQGTGSQVLDGPLHALRHFVHEMQNCPGAPTLRAGDVVTTGTWTDAWPMAGGQRWRAEFDTPLGSLSLDTK